MENMTDDALTALLFRVMTGRSATFTITSAMEGKRVTRWLERDHLLSDMVAPVKAMIADPVCFCWAGAAYDAVYRLCEDGIPPVVTVTPQMAAALLAMSYDQDFQREAAKSAGYGSYTIPDRAFWEGDPDEIPDGE
jgi:D-alanyl-D-alanine carboxypeptidase